MPFNDVIGSTFNHYCKIHFSEWIFFILLIELNLIMELKLKFTLLFCSFLFIQIGITQTVWEKYPNPVLQRSATFPDWKALATADPFVMMDNDTLKMWFSASGWLSAADDCPHVRIGYAWSLDGITWTEYINNPVLDINPDTAKFDSDGVETPTILRDETAPASQRYKMWYAGRKSNCSPINDHRFGYAFSPDGIHWTKYENNPVMSPGLPEEWFNTFISSPCVIYEDFTYKMWFTASDLVFNGQETDGHGNIGYAVSSDGIEWLIYPYPIVAAGAQDNWDSAVAAEPSVIKVGDFYHLFYSALDKWDVENFQVGYAVSNDAINFTKSTSNPVLKIGEPGTWDAFWASHPTVIYDANENKFKMWYTGRDKNEIVDLINYFWDIGYAETPYLDEIKTINAADLYLQISPNPAQTYIRIISNTNISELYIFSIDGLIAQKIENADNVDISGLTPGLYFIRSFERGNVTGNFVKF